MILSHLEIIPIDVLDHSATAIRFTDNLVSFKASRWSAVTGPSCTRTTQAAVTVVPVLQAVKKIHSMRFFHTYVV